ncbi:MAG: hypothetical protein JW735_10890 [Prolixibacteraceae bacterium]|nr:hypothetical protein [Prolixibacteraceae bacterium]
MGRLCIYAGQCPVHKGLVALKQPLFLVKNIYCNNGPRWWNKCKVYVRFEAGDEINDQMVPADDLSVQ